MTEDPPASGTAAALLGPWRTSHLDAWVARTIRELIGVEVERVLFRSGRIDAVFGMVVSDGRRLVLKVHRPPVDRAIRHANARAQGLLAAAGFPCASPLVEGASIDGRTVSVETLLDAGEPGNAHDPAVRRAIAVGLAEQIALLGAADDLVSAGRQAPAWCRYAGGPWPTPHDSLFDFRSTPRGWEWLDELARAAATTIVDSVAGDGRVTVAHADWYCGNLRFDGGRLVACFDWDLVADTPAVVAGLTAGFFSHGSNAGDEQATPDEVAAFLRDFEAASGRLFDALEQRAAGAAATWSVAYAARCQLQMLDGDPAPGSPLDALLHRGRDYLALRW